MRACSICFSPNFQASRKADRSRQVEKVKLSNKEEECNIFYSAFVEFADPGAATSAKDALQGFKVTPDRPIKLTYAKN